MKAAEKKLPKGISVRTDGRYQGRFTFCGERHTFYDRNVKELQKKMAEALYELEHGIYANNPKITFERFFETWLEESKKSTIKSNTLAVYQEIYKVHIKPAFGGVQMTLITKLMIQKLLNQMSKNGLSANTVSKAKAIMYSVFKEAIENRIITINPCENITVKKENTVRRVLSKEEQTKFMHVIRGSRYEHLCVLGLATGLRIGELTGLCWSDIDFEAKTLTVNRTYVYVHQVTKGQMAEEFHSPKTKTSKRTIKLLDNILDMLERHRRMQEFEKAKMGSEWQPVEGGEDLVFTTRNGKPVKGLYVNETFQFYVDKINKEERLLAQAEGREPVLFAKITPHTLRHTFATRAFESGIPPKVVQEILGHSSLNMTMDLYTHVTEDVQTKEIQKMKSFFSEWI